MAKSEYTARLVTRIRPSTGRRLRLAAAVEGQGIGELVDVALTQHLPSDAELASAITKGSGADDVPE